MCGQLLLANWMHLHNLVVSTVSLQGNAGVVPSVRDGGDNGAVAGPAGYQIEEGGAEGRASGGVRAGDRHRRSRIVGGPPMRRRPVPQAPLGWHLR